MIGVMLLSATLPLVPAQMPALALSNARMPLGGEFGPLRAHNKILPGDIFFLAFDIENLQLDAEGRANFTMALTVTNSAGKTIYEQKAARQETQLPLGGSKLPARAYMDTSVDMPAGSYTCEVIVTDLGAKSTRTLSHKFEVLPKSFGIVRLYCAGDDKGEVPMPFRGVAGQTLWLHFVLVGFERAGDQPNIDIEFRALDDKNSATLPKPRTATVKEGVPAADASIPISLPLPLNRVGDFTIEITAKDKISGKTSTLPIRVRVEPQEK